MRRVAFITGAGSGIGRAVALRLAAAGYDLALVGRREDALRETLRLAGREELAITADLARAEEGERAVDAALTHFGRLDAVVNNAGGSVAATIAQTTPALARRVFELNAITPLAILSRAWPALVARRDDGGARIVNVSSMATVEPYPFLYAYAAAKSAMNSLTRSAAIEGRDAGVWAFAVAPGAVETPLLRSLVPEAALPRSRTLPPDEVARVVAACVLGERDSESGTTIFVPSP